MIVTVDPSFQSAIDALCFPGIMIGHRLISPGDEHALLPEEAPAFASSVVKVRRGSRAARLVGRQLPARPGDRLWPMPEAPSGGPVLPAGIGGPLTHHSRVAGACVWT